MTQTNSVTYTARSGIPARDLRIAGHSLIETAIVLVIIGVLIMGGFWAYTTIQKLVDAALCRVNQQGLRDQATLYASLQNLDDGILTGRDLLRAGFATDRQCQCPSGDGDFADDYTITVSNGAVTSVRCGIALRHGLDVKAADSGKKEKIEPGPRSWSWWFGR